MKRPLLLFFIITLFFHVFADEGDTIVVQTIDFETPVNSGWNSPREGTYQFPSDTISFSKILMSYTLKCDPGQSPACGEWDYTTHTKIWEHTGNFDSTEYSHPEFKVNNSAPDTLNVMNQISYYYEPWLEYSNQTTALTETTIGENNSTISLPFGDANDGRAQFIYQGDELLEDGLSAGNLTALILNVAGDISFKHLSIKMKYAENDTLELNTFENSELTNVFEKNLGLTDGDNQIDFSHPFYWNGASDLLIDISYAESSGSAQLTASTTISAETQVSGNIDNFLHFSGWDLVELSPEVFETLEGEVTITLWQYGDPEKQPMNNSIFNGINNEGKRVLNSHLPWSNGQVYWDAGQDGGYDRINHNADAEDYEGRWNHWAFTKKISNGSMRMYLNGQIFYPESGKYRTMEGLFEFFIGGTKTANFYEGMIDDFCVWDAEVDYLTIREWMNKEIDESHPYYDNLRAYYKFDEGSGIEIGDHSPHAFEAIDFFGRPQWKNYEGKNRHKYGQRLNEKPFLKLQIGDYNASLLDSIVVVDTFEYSANNIIFYDTLNPLIPTDTILRWPSYYNNFVYDAGGIAIDSTLVPPDSTFYNDEIIYYGNPFELLIPWEIGRFITPYGNNLSLGEGFTWVYDVTDYAPLLRDSVNISAGNFQELLDLKFLMIEGTPPRDVLKIDKVYSGYWYLNQFEEKVPPKKIEIIEGSSQWKVKSRTTGHLFDNPTNCAEFCDKTQTFLVEGQEIASWEIIQECAENPLHPQGGTWIYDRAGWCPGMDVTEQDFEISNYVKGDSVLLDYNTEYDEYGRYVLETHMFSYASFNFNNDAAVTEIIAPNNLKRYGRFNPTATNPMIVIQNLGSNNLTSLDIQYGPAGVDKQTYNWTGMLEPMQQEEVILDDIGWEEWQIGNGKFEVHILNPNGTDDENTINDWYFSNYDEVDIYPGTFVIHFTTNKAAYQNYYEILTSNGLQLFKKDNLDNQTLYIDTISFINGCYDFYLHDSGDNGIYFWAEAGQGNGSLKFYDLDGNKIKQFNSDFGDRIYNSFYADMYLGTNETKKENFSFSISPNPNNGQFAVSYALKEKSEINISIHDSQGKQIFTKVVDADRSGNLNINLGNPVSGIYNLSIESDGNLVTKKFVVL